MTAFTPANQLTLLRMLLIPAFVILVIYGSLGWALVVFVFFSASGSKLPPYIVPIFPALAVLAAHALTPRVLSAQALMIWPA